MKNMAKYDTLKSTSSIFAILSIFLIADTALAKSNRKFLDSSHPLAKAVAMVDQINGPGVIGNGVIVGEGGCYALTNFHIAFGKSKDTKTGFITMVDKVGVGHSVKLDVALDSRQGVGPAIPRQPA